MGKFTARLRSTASYSIFDKLSECDESRNKSIELSHRKHYKNNKILRTLFFIGNFGAFTHITQTYFSTCLPDIFFASGWCTFHFFNAPAFVYNQTWNSSDRQSTREKRQSCRSAWFIFSAVRLKLNILEIDSQNIRVNTPLQHAKIFRCFWESLLANWIQY